MRDTYVFFLFTMFIASGTFLAYSGKVEPQLVLTPIVTGFLGLLASVSGKNGSGTTPNAHLQMLPGAYVPKWTDRIGLTSKPPPSEAEKEKDKP
jgi:hypothetical protein